MIKDLDEILDKLVQRIDSKDTEEKLSKKFEEIAFNKKIVSEYDIISTIGLTLIQYNKLQQWLEDPDISEEQAEKITHIVSKIRSYCRTNKMLNDYSIKNGARMSKTTMFYMLKEQEEEKELVIINVNVVGDDPLTIKKLKENK